MQALMGRIKRGAVSMPKRRKRRRTNISDAETSAVPVQEAAEVPPVEPEVACQPEVEQEVARRNEISWSNSKIKPTYDHNRHTIHGSAIASILLAQEPLPLKIMPS